MEPSHLLIVSSCCPPNPKSRLYSHIEEHMPDTKIIPFDRRHWSEVEGLDRIQTLAFREDAEAVKVAIEGSFFATCSFSAAVEFLEVEFSLRIIPNSLRVRYQPSEDTMMIDVSAIISLEILQNLRASKSKDSLFGILKHTRTPMGSRVLRSNLLQPSTLKDSYLEPRYDALDELLSNHEMFLGVREALKSIPDIEIKNLIYQDILEDVTYVKSALDLRNQRTFAVKSGVNGLLDVARQAYKENTNDVHSHVEELSKEYGIEADLRYDTSRKYWIRLRAVDFEDRQIPPVLVNQTRKGPHIECLTMRLKKLNQRITDSVAEVVMLSDKVIQDLIDSVRTQLQPLYRVCDSIALLDMIASFAHASSIHDWKRPEISETLALKSARHPILDKTSRSPFVPNDYYATEEYRFHVVTGCNMSGKTTYIRSIALLQIMAQVGCFVPAEFASFPVVHNIFARVTTDDHIETNMSTFSLEMREMAFILSNVTDRSIVIIDELGRGTSTRDGLAISIAMAEALIQSRALVWFATHFTELADILADRPEVLNLHLVTQVSTTADDVPKMTMLYKVESGKNKEILYGITLAKAMGFPKRFLEVAEQVAVSLRQKRERNKQGSEARKMLNRRKLILNLHGQLRQASESELDEDSLRSYLIRLREEFILRMEAIENGGSGEEIGGSEDRPDDEDGMFDDDDVFDAVDLESLSSSYLWESQKDADILLTAGTNQWRLHERVIRGKSRLIDRIIDTTDAQEGIRKIVLKEHIFSLSALGVTLKFLYVGDSALNKKNEIFELLSVFQTAAALTIPSLQQLVAPQIGSLFSNILDSRMDLLDDFMIAADVIASEQAESWTILRQELQKVIGPHLGMLFSQQEFVDLAKSHGSFCFETLSTAVEQIKASEKDAEAFFDAAKAKSSLPSPAETNISTKSGSLMETAVGPLKVAARPVTAVIFGSPSNDNKQSGNSELPKFEGKVENHGSRHLSQIRDPSCPLVHSGPSKEPQIRESLSSISDVVSNSDASIKWESCSEGDSASPPSGEKLQIGGVSASPMQQTSTSVTPTNQRCKDEETPSVSGVAERTRTEDELSGSSISQREQTTAPSLSERRVPPVFYFTGTKKSEQPGVANIERPAASHASEDAPAPSSARSGPNRSIAPRNPAVRNGPSSLDPRTAKQAKKGKLVVDSTNNRRSSLHPVNLSGPNIECNPS
ncbi:DNA mismatch repair protein [Colletotrichum tabaci]|uniref:DNA mismatch repair protein MSH3 n=1 Tax=Colletotrichum tabaci TaxID=1209068 RepID=A0AAV9T475_9PEZI